MKNKLKGKAVIWITDHIKEIGIGVGLISLVAISHWAGYRKAQREIENEFNKAWCTMLEGMIRGGDEWTK